MVKVTTAHESVLNKTTGMEAVDSAALCAQMVKVTTAHESVLNKTTGMEAVDSAALCV